MIKTQEAWILLGLLTFCSSACEKATDRGALPNVAIRVQGMTKILDVT